MSTKMISDIYRNSRRLDFQRFQGKASGDEFVWGFKNGGCLENQENEIEGFSATEGSLPDYQSSGGENYSYKLEKNSEPTAQTGDNFVDYDSEQLNLVGCSNDTKQIRNKWIDSVENLLDLAAYGKGQLNSRKKFNEERVSRHPAENPEKWMLLSCI